MKIQKPKIILYFMYIYKKRIIKVVCKIINPNLKSIYVYKIILQHFKKK